MPDETEKAKPEQLDVMPAGESTVQDALFRDSYAASNNNNGSSRSSDLNARSMSGTGPANLPDAGIGKDGSFYFGDASKLIQGMGAEMKKQNPDGNPNNQDKSVPAAARDNSPTETPRQNSYENVAYKQGDGKVPNKQPSQAEVNKALKDLKEIADNDPTINKGTREQINRLIEAAEKGVKVPGDVPGGSGSAFNLADAKQYAAGAKALGELASKVKMFQDPTKAGDALRTILGAFIPQDYKAPDPTQIGVDAAVKAWTAALGVSKAFEAGEKDNRIDQYAKEAMDPNKSPAEVSEKLNASKYHFSNPADQAEVMRRMAANSKGKFAYDEKTGTMDMNKDGKKVTVYERKGAAPPPPAPGGGGRQTGEDDSFIGKMKKTFERVGVGINNRSNP